MLSVLLGNERPLFIALVADPSVNIWIHPPCGYLSAVIARVSPPEREETEEECALGQSVVKLTSQPVALMIKTASFQPILGETLLPGFHGMIWHSSELVCLHQNLGVPPLT